MATFKQGRWFPAGVWRRFQTFAQRCAPGLLRSTSRRAPLCAARVPQSAHTFGLRGCSDLLCARAPDHEGLDRVRPLQHVENARAATISRTVARLTPARLKKRSPACLGRHGHLRAVFLAGRAPVPSPGTAGLGIRNRSRGNASNLVRDMRRFEAKTYGRIAATQEELLDDGRPVPGGPEAV